MGADYEEFLESRVHSESTGADSNVVQTTTAIFVMS